MARIKDVAQRAGVSSATVSRVINGDDRVSATARERVLTAARELDYRPNRMARNLRRQTSEMIGVVVSDIENPHFTEAVRAIELVAFERGYHVLLCNTDETQAKQRAYLETLAAERVRGVILVPASADDPMIAELLSGGTPVVALDRSVDDPRADTVIADNHTATIRAVHHLVDIGCQAIGFVGGRTEIQTGRERLAGYLAVMDDLRMPPRHVGGAFRVEEARAATRQLLEGYPEIDGLVIANNLMTMGALKTIRAMGIRIGRDLRVVSFDNPVWAEFTEPPLTSLAQPVRRMADQAAELLFERIEATRDQSRTVVFGFELIVRASSGTPVQAASTGTS